MREAPRLFPREAIRAEQMQVGAYQFVPSLIPTLAALVFLALLVSLGFWQLGRADDKRVARAAVESGAQAEALTEPALMAALRDSPDGQTLAFRLIRLAGRFLPERQFLLDNRTHQGRAGFHVITPFELSDGRVVLVNRGWVRANPDRSVLPDVSFDAPPARVEGRLSLAREDVFVLGETGYDGDIWPRVVQRIERGPMAHLLGTGVLPLVVLQRAGQQDGLVRDWPAHQGLPAQRHTGYAFQWFALAVTLLVVYLVVAFRKVEPGGGR